MPITARVAPKPRRPRPGQAVIDLSGQRSAPIFLRMPPEWREDLERIARSMNESGHPLKFAKSKDVTAQDVVLAAIDIFCRSFFFDRIRQSTATEVVDD